MPRRTHDPKSGPQVAAPVFAKPGIIKIIETVLMIA